MLQYTTLQHQDINLTVSEPPINYCKLKKMLLKSLACFSFGHLWILFNSTLFFPLWAYGWLDCVGPCQRPSITPRCPAELEIHSTALSPQNEKTRARGNKVRFRKRRERGKKEMEGEKNELTAIDRWERSEQRGKKSKERTKYKDE